MTIPAIDRENGLKPARGILIALIICLAAYALFIALLFMVFRAPFPDRTLPPAEKVRYDRLLMKHGLAGRFSVIEVRDNGKLWFEREGEKCKFQ